MSDVVAVGQLRAFVERIERLEEEIKERNDDKSEVYKEIRGFGFDVKAVRKVVAKRKLDPSVANEQDAVFDLYWDALTGASHVHVHEAGDSYAAEKGVDREARRKQRMSESMDDSIALSAEAVALGLIDPSAHEETVRIADAVARKFGNGPLNEQIDPDTGEITASHGKASDGMDPSADHVSPQARNPNTGNGSANVGGNDVDRSAERAVHNKTGNASLAAREGEKDAATNSPETANEDRSASTVAPETQGKQCTSVVSKDEAGQNLTGNNSQITPDPRPLTAADGQPRIPSSSPGSAKSNGLSSVVGQDRESDIDVSGNEEEQAVNNFEPPAFIRKATSLRPDCLKPDACAGYGSHQCHACTKAAREVAA